MIPMVKSIITQSKTIETRGLAQSRRRKISPKIFDLPPELFYYQILDRLRCKDILKLEIGFQTAIPDAYWRHSKPPSQMPTGVKGSLPA
jgi:hypothetical protein